MMDGAAGWAMVAIGAVAFALNVRASRVCMVVWMIGTGGLAVMSADAGHGPIAVMLCLSAVHAVWAWVKWGEEERRQREAQVAWYTGEQWALAGDDDDEEYGVDDGDPECWGDCVSCDATECPDHPAAEWQG